MSAALAQTQRTGMPQVRVAPRAPDADAAGSGPDAEHTRRVLSTLNQDGSRRWLKPRVSRGRFLQARRVVAILLIALFTLLPYAHIGGKPAILLDIAARRFTILGATFLPTDTVLLALLLVSIFIAVFLATALLGRIWCGWACPQTVYMEFVFRPLERLFDGPPERRTPRGFRGSGFAKVLKYLSYVVVSLYLAHTFLAYFVPIETLAQWVRSSPVNHPAGFLVMASVTALMLFDFCIFREQTCIVACPYGRFQSVMLDRQSLIISYDAKRGEPRGKKRRATDHQLRLTTERAGAAVTLPVLETPATDSSLVIGHSSFPAGDCIDCSMCVTTCPTGIDIRDGLQMECIGCAQCIDACDAVMDKIGRARGLIRYSSQAAMVGERSRLLRPRVVIYPLLLTILLGLFAIALAQRGDANVTLLRGLGRPFTETSSGEIANPVRIKIVNRTDHVAHYTIASDTGRVRVQAEEDPVILQAGESRTVPAMIVAPADLFEHGKCEAKLTVSDGGRFNQRFEWELLGPGAHNPKNGRQDSADHEQESGREH